MDDAQRRAAETGDELGEGKLPDDLSSLREYLFHPCTDLRQAAIRALGRREDVESVGELIGLLEAGLDPFDHDDIYDAFKAMGAPAVPALAQLVQRGPRAERASALFSLGLMGPVGVPALAEFLPRFPTLTLRALVNCDDPRMVLPLIRELQRGSTSRAKILSRLARCCDPTCQWAVPLLLELLPQIPGQAAAEALVALGRIDDVRALPVLVEALHGKYAAAAAQALGTMTGPHSLVVLMQAIDQDQDHEAMDHLLAGALQHPLNDFEGRRRIALKIAENPQAFQIAHYALGELDDLERLAESVEQPTTPERALKLAATFGRGRRSWQRASHDQDPKVRRLAAKLYGFVEDAGPFEHLLTDSCWRVREAMTECLWGEEHVRLVIGMLKDPRPGVRLAALRNLPVIPRLPRFLTILAADRSSRVRREAAQLARCLEGNLKKKVWIKLMTSFLTIADGDVKLEDGETVRSILARAQRTDAHPARKTDRAFS